MNNFNRRAKAHSDATFGGACLLLAAASGVLFGAHIIKYLVG